MIHFVPAALGANGLFESRLRARSRCARPRGAGLLAIDHVALGLRPDQLDTWVLFCRAVLGLEPGESLELADPFGLIRSSGVANARAQRALRAQRVAEPAHAHGAHA